MRIRVHLGPSPDDERVNGLPPGSVGAIIEVSEDGPPPPPQGETGWRATSRTRAAARSRTRATVG